MFPCARDMNAVPGSWKGSQLQVHGIKHSSRHPGERSLNYIILGFMIEHVASVQPTKATVT